MEQPSAYVGSESYVFISYSHLDKAKVYADLCIMQKHGIRLWYDQALDVGDKWDETVKSRIGDERCEGVIFYLSENFCLSESLEKEVDFVCNISQKRFFCINIGDISILSLISPNFMQIPQSRIALYTTVFANNIIYILWEITLSHINKVIDKLVSFNVVNKEGKEAHLQKKYVQKVLMIAKKSNFSGSLISGIQDYFSKNQDMTLNVEYLGSSCDSEQMIIDIINRNLSHYCCFIIRPISIPTLRFAQYISEIRKLGKVIIFMDINMPETLVPNDEPNLIYVGSDFTAGGAMVGREIVKLVSNIGKRHSRILFLNGPIEKDSVNLRCCEIRKSIVEADLESISDTVIINSLDPDDVYSEIEAYFDRSNFQATLHNKHCIIYCGNDTIAEKFVTEYIKRKGSIFETLKSANDVIFVGYDGIKDITGGYILSKYPCDSLTIDVLPIEQGIKAGEIASKAIYREPYDDKILITPKLKRHFMITPPKYNNINKISSLLDNSDLFIFDLDGTIADTEPLHWEAYNVLLERFGVHLNDTDVARYIGNAEVKIYDMIRRDFNIDFDGTTFLSERIKIYLELVEKNNLQPFSYIRDIIYRYPDKRYGILSSQIPEVIDYLLERWGMEEIFPANSRISVSEGKLLKSEVLANYERYYNVCMDSQKLIVFEDSEHTLTTSVELGITSIGIEHKYNKGKLLHCDAIICGSNKIGMFVGLCGYDLVYYIDSIPKEDDKAKTEQFRQALGGPAANAAITYAKLGGHSILVTCIGNSALGLEIKSRLKSMGIQVVDMIEEQMTEPNVSSIFVNTNSGSRTIISGQNSNIICSATLDFEDLCEQVEFCLYDCNLRLLPAPILEMLKALGKPIVLDAGSWKGDMPYFLSICTELIASKKFITTAGNLALISEKYPNIINLAMTDGPDPIEIYNHVQPKYIPIIRPLNVVDTLGAGDVLHGAYCYYRFNFDNNFEESLRLASVVATHKVGEYGVIKGVDSFVEKAI